MKIFQFASGLLPNFERSRITADAAALKEELHNSLLPTFKNAAGVFKNPMSYTSEYSKKKNDVFGRLNPNQKRNGYIAGIYNVLTQLSTKLAAVDALVPELFAKDIAKESVTVRKANVLQFFGAVRFVNEYAGRLLLNVLAKEFAASNSSSPLAKLQVTPYEEKYLENNFQQFVQVLTALENLPRDIQKLIKETPDLQIQSGRELEMQNLVGARAMDPMRMGFIPLNLNIIYRLRMNIAEWQTKRYHVRVNEKTALELRILALKQSQNGGEVDPKIQQAIDYNEARLERLRAELADLEERYT